MNDIDDQTPRQITMNRELPKDVLLIAENVLTMRQLFIVKKRFGLDGTPPMTLLEIGKQLRLCSERVRVLLLISLEQIKRHM